MNAEYTTLEKGAWLRFCGGYELLGDFLVA